MNYPLCARLARQIFMTYARHVHQLSYAAGQVTVHIFMRRNFFQRKPVEHTCLIWPKLDTGFTKVECTFRYSYALSLSFFESKALMC